MNMKKGYKIVWRPEGAGVAESLNSDILPGASRQYEPGKPVEPAPELGPLCVYDADGYKAARELAAHYAVAVRKDRGHAEIWEVDWLPWESALPVFTLKSGAEIEAVLWFPAVNELKGDAHFMRKIVMRIGLPTGTRLARQVILRRLVRRVRAVGKSRRAKWEKPCGNN